MGLYHCLIDPHPVKNIKELQDKVASGLFSSEYQEENGRVVSVHLFSREMSFRKV